ncbi:TP901 family phage tail tape measure protein [Microbacterium resistens]|uniref:TP901 family phage tail tape measure protein n=2 Tax=Microbacterium resistens TaxID=156977 RepID=A0ABU1SHV0_9MICO|nr:TP901 family phage tail tape measure protein [Microbacterium resistens]
MIDLGESTNLSAEEAATSLARFVNIMGTSQDKVSNLGSALVGLGNNYATTEAEIMAMAMRLAGAGKQIGLSEGQVLGLSTALSSVGIEAEAGGSAMSKVMIDIAAAADSGGAKLDKVASAAGMSSEAFAKLWKSNPAEALSAFVKGLANAESQGQSTLGVLADLGITEVRMRDALLRSSAAADMFAGAMSKGSEEFEKNNALAEEAAKRYETAESKMRIAGNAVRDAAIDFGQVLLPAVTAAADGVKGFADFMGDLPDPVQGLIVIGGVLAGTLVLVGSAALMAVPKMVEFKLAMETLGVTGASVRAGWGRLTSFLGGPWGIAFVGAAVAVEGLKLANDAGTASTAELANSLRTASDAATVFQKATSGHSIENFVRGDGMEDLRKLPELMDAAAVEWTDLNLSLGQTAALDRLGDIGKALAALAAEDLPRATEQFNMLAEGMNPTQAEELLRRLGPEFREALVGVADGAQLAANDSTLLAIATGKSAATAESAADAYLAEADRVDDLSSQMQELIDRINEANGVNQDAVSANASYLEALSGISAEVDRQRDAYEQLNGTTDGFVLSLDQSTVAGSANAAMLSDVAARAQDAASKQFEVEKVTLGAKTAAENYSATLGVQRQALEDAATAAGFSAEEVQLLADKVFALPEAKAVAILAETAAAQSAVDQFIFDNSGRTVPIWVNPQVQSMNDAFAGYLAKPNERGGFYSYEAFEGGGIRSNVPSGIYPGGAEIHKFAEKSLAWEAYISPKADQRDRNVGVWMETGDRLGVLGPLVDSIAAAQGQGQGLMPGDRLSLVVDGREFEAYVQAKAAGVVAANEQRQMSSLRGE